MGKNVMLNTEEIQEQRVSLNLDEESSLIGQLTIPEGAGGLVIFVHGTGSGRLSPRNQTVAKDLNHAGLATLLFDLLTTDEISTPSTVDSMRFDVGLLTQRLEKVTQWAVHDTRTCNMEFGYFGSSTGAAVALVAAAKNPGSVKAIISRGGRSDLADAYLKDVHAAVCFIAGELDPQIIRINEASYRRLPAETEKSMVVINGAGHLFEEFGKLEEVATHARDWFKKYL